MATYYRWRKSTPSASFFQVLTTFTYRYGISTQSIYPKVVYSNQVEAYYDEEDESPKIKFINPSISTNSQVNVPAGYYCIGVTSDVSPNQGFGQIYRSTNTQNQTICNYMYITEDNSYGFQIKSSSGDSNVSVFTSGLTAGSFIENVYSNNSNTYPNSGILNGYYYGNRSVIISPTIPTSLTYPAIISSTSIDISWDASISNVPSYTVTNYEVSYNINGSNIWTIINTTTQTNLTVEIPSTATSIQFRVRAQDSNNQWSSYTTGSTSQILPSPVLTVSSFAMQGQNITINWTAVTGATSYTLQRQANTDDGWQQVYSGSNLTFTETVGTWTSVQYQVQAVFSSGAGPWATSSSIPVIEASALVISGTDSNLGTITSDIPYTVSSDTGNDITLTRTVNGVQVASLTVQSGFAYNIPVVDLPTGTGTIVISASVNTSGGSPVTATRTWTYTKTAMTFPNSAGIGQLAQNGQNIWPLTVPDAIKTPAYLGGDLGKTLEMLGPLALAGAKIETGSYVGTGTYGADNPNTLTFGFEPKLLLIREIKYDLTQLNNATYIDCFALNSEYLPNAQLYHFDIFLHCYAKKIGNTVYWYSTQSNSHQCNTETYIYKYMAIG